MKLFIPMFLLFSLCHAADIDMYSALREHTNHQGAVILLAQASVECGYNDRIGLKSVKGVARFNLWNIWNISSATGRVHYEREGGRLIKKRWAYWDTPQEGALEFIAYLNRKYPGAIEAAERGDVKSYVRILHKGGYFSSDAGEYERNMGRAVRGIEK